MSDIEKLETETKKSKTASPVPMRIERSARGISEIVTNDTSELMRLIGIMMEGKAFPKTLDTHPKIIAAWQMAASLGLSPMAAMPNMAIINGAISLWGQLPKALAERTGEMTDFSLVYLNDKQEIISLSNKNIADPVWAAVCTMQRKGRSANEYFFSIDDAKKAKLFGKSGPWTEYTKIMLARRAVGNAVKFEFPDALMGVAIAEYDFNQMPDYEPTPDRDVAETTAKEKINNLLKQ